MGKGSTEPYLFLPKEEEEYIRYGAFHMHQHVCAWVFNDREWLWEIALNSVGANKNIYQVHMMHIGYHVQQYS